MQVAHRRRLTLLVRASEKPYELSPAAEHLDPIVAGVGHVNVPLRVRTETTWGLQTPCTHINYQSYVCLYSSMQYGMLNVLRMHF